MIYVLVSNRSYFIYVRLCVCVFAAELYARHILCMKDKRTKYKRNESFLLEMTMDCNKGKIRTMKTRTSTHFCGEYRAGEQCVIVYFSISWICEICSNMEAVWSLLDMIKSHSNLQTTSVSNGFQFVWIFVVLGGTWFVGILIVPLGMRIQKLFELESAGMIKSKKYIHENNNSHNNDNKRRKWIASVGFLVENEIVFLLFSFGGYFYCSLHHF